MPSSMVLLRTHFSHRPLLHTLDLGMGPSVVDCCRWICSMYAAGNCNLNVPFCGMCNTQLHVGLLSFLLPILFAYILLRVRIPREAWLRGSFLHFPRCDLWFFPLMCPSHLDLSASFVVPILLGVRWLSPRDVPLIVLSCGCSLVGS